MDKGRDGRGKKWTRRLWILPPLLIGLTALLLAPRLKRGPQTQVPVERAAKVRVMEISPLAVVPRAVGYGTVRPGRTWEAVAEVTGQVVWISEALKKGRTVTTGTELLRIADADYRLTLAEAEAQLQASRVEGETFRTTHALLEKEVALLRDDYQRQLTLAASGTVSRASVDAAERQLLNSRARVQELKTAAELNTVERRALEAKKSGAELDLGRTRLIAPFDARLTLVQVGLAQHASRGQLLFSADGLDVAEVEAQFPIGTLRPLVGATLLSAADATETGVLALNAIVRLQTASHVVVWPARIDRVSGVVDPLTQSLGVVVAIDHPAELARPGERPPLYRNTFVQVELFSEPIPNRIVVPLSSLHQGRLYLVNEEQRLESRAVTTSFTQGSIAVLKEGLTAGERIVISDLAAAVEGMLLEPRSDAQVTQRLAAEAAGQRPRR